MLVVRQLGTARTGACFSPEWLVGAAISRVLLGQQSNPLFWAAALLMVAIIWLDLIKCHEHAHEHKRVPMGHTQALLPDARYQNLPYKTALLNNSGLLFRYDSFD